jgi:glycine betaine/proline transport system substrate-binding protein
MKNRTTALIALGAVGMLALAGCAPAASETVGDGNKDNKELNLAVFNGWDEGIAASELWKAILDEKGYDVELSYADAAPVFLGLSKGDYDLTMDVWLPDTHAAYLDEYGDDITDLGAWNEESKLTVAVNEDAPIDSLAELADNADLFNNEIVGIEPGAGLTAAMEERVIPGYGLEDMDFTTSSTAAMLTALTKATDAGENIVVTLWEPHWANAEFPIKTLEDPEGTLADLESLHAFGSADFEADFPQVAEWMDGFEMDLETLYSENQDYVDGLTS